MSARSDSEEIQAQWREPLKRWSAEVLLRHRTVSDFLSAGAQF
jgi:hypothetical protein